ncbi:hypothetical protein LCGC14_2635590, partial [marine sediment metagenome]
LSNAGQSWIMTGFKNSNYSANAINSKYQLPEIIAPNGNNERVTIREASLKDVERIHAIEVEVWGQKNAASINQISSRIDAFPSGNLVAEADNNILGYSSFILTNFDRFANNSEKDWYSITDNGYVSNHNPHGKDLFGINFTVHPKAPRSSFRLLILAIAKRGIECKVRRYMLGSRIPSYHKYCDTMSVEEYVHAKTSSGNYLDPELCLYRKKGLKVIDIVPGFFKDPDSKDYGVIVKQDNPFYRMPYRMFSSFITHLPLNTVRLIDRFQ